MMSIRRKYFSFFLFPIHRHANHFDFDRAMKKKNSFYRMYYANLKRWTFRFIYIIYPECWERKKRKEEFFFFSFQFFLWNVYLFNVYTMFYLVYCYRLNIFNVSNQEFFLFFFLYYYHVFFLSLDDFSCFHDRIFYFFFILLVFLVSLSNS